MTNRDKLNAMSNEELAKSDYLGCSACAYNNDENCKNRCIKGTVKWLESEAEE